MTLLCKISKTVLYWACVSLEDNRVNSLDWNWFLNSFMFVAMAGKFLMKVLFSKLRIEDSWFTTVRTLENTSSLSVSSNSSKFNSKKKYCCKSTYFL
ncbi:hypothetical protein WICPIJ_005957 [Wickerhamomyces pijperi]|uniref:Ig-like domain-containing protein n=1 Tax=Wickerhamomyces pijperi TaxID=599730 RepID=A0A9P8Q5C4_WICPI|nr:hypothetical protein WICPIJ_005957 [Wickerhamomyces pijperi]